jgi:hypothetical protein
MTNRNPTQYEEPASNDSQVVFHPPEQYRSHEHWAFSFWDAILAYYKMGGKPEDRHVAALLRRHEPIPPEAQEFLADVYVERRPRPRGAPSKPTIIKDVARIKKARAFVQAIEQLRRNSAGEKPKTLREALAEYKRLHPTKELSSIKRHYREAVKLKRQDEKDFAQAIKVAAGLLGLTPDDFLKRANSRPPEK